MYKPLLAFSLAFFSLNHISAQTSVWSTDVAPILYNNCASCHRSGGIAPFSLLSYTEATAMGPSIKADVEARRMPPWPPDPAYSRLAHEKLLSSQEIKKISDWVNGGMPQGNPNLAPPVPTFSNKGDLPGTPDLISKIPSYTSTASNGDVYQCFVIPSGISTSKFISSFEAIPGNRAMVHHVLVFADTTGTCAHLDAASPGPGYANFGGVGTSSAILLGAWVPGSAPVKYPAGFGVRLPPNADIVVQIHYPAGTAGLSDSTEVHFYFAPSGPIRSLSIAPALNHNLNLQNGPLFIPAGQTKSFTERLDLPSFIDYSLLGMAPHMHLLGQNISSFGVTPTGDTQKYIRINEWDFHWQGFYMFKKIKKVVGGTSLYANAFYDNTANNPENPNNPPKDVSLGEATTDEMMLVYAVYTLYQPGDENIVIDSTDPLGVAPAQYYHGQQLLDLSPVPASGQFVLKCFFEQQDRASIDIINMEGRVIKRLMANEVVAPGYHALAYSVGDLPSGLYQVKLKTGERTFTGKLLVQH